SLLTVRRAPEIYTPSLHDALPIYRVQEREVGLLQQVAAVAVGQVDHAVVRPQVAGADAGQVLAAELGVPLVRGAEVPAVVDHVRSEEHTSELQSRENLVCRLLLEK